MKHYVGATVNFAKSLKSCDEDINEEHVYAEVNVIFSETKYEISNAQNLSRATVVDELELVVTASNARKIAETFADIADKLEKLKDR